MSEDFSESLQQKKGGLTPKELILKYLRYLPWLIISLAIMLMFAYLKLRYSTPIFNVSSKLQVKNNTQSSGASEKFDDIFMTQGSRNNMNDEIEIIKSRYMAKRVIANLQFQTQYFNKGQFRSSTIHPKDMPFIAELGQGTDSSKFHRLEIKVLSETEFTIGDPPVKYQFGQWVNVGESKWRLTRTNRTFEAFSSKEFALSWVPIESAAASLSGSIKVNRSDNYSSMLTIGFETDNTSMGEDIVNKYMAEYQSYSLEDKRQVAFNTLLFINEQLDTVRTQLGSVERTLKDFKEQNKIFDPEGQAKGYLDDISEAGRQLTEQSVKLKIIDQLYAYINDQKNPFRIVPTSLGIQEPSLLQQIAEYNRLLLDREATVTTIPAGNPIVVKLDAAINKLRVDMLDNLANIRKTYKISLIDLSAKTSLSESRVGSVPGVQKRLLEISRQQKILEELYSFLLQKKLETSIGSASTISSIRVVEPAFSSDTPISPDKKSIYLMTIFIGILIPVGIVFLLDYMNDRVQTKRDVQKVTDAPILGEVGHSDDSNTLVVGKNNRKVVAEQFRMIRTNLQFILHAKKKVVIMVTSSFSGEGKSFISTNVAGVIALTGKKTVILEFDIRKPKIIQGLGLNRSNGITNYIVGSVDLKELPIPVKQQDNLYVIPCGPVPPNPAELLLDPKIAELFEYAKKEFDVIVIDTAPVGLVSDAITLGQYADATIYIVRHDYTQKRQIQLIEELYSSKKLPSLSVVINDIRLKLGYGGYYGYGGYGYGYGYGYGSRSSNYNDASGYFGETQKRTSILRRIVRKLKGKK